MVLRSPLCYPGGKSRLVKVLLDHIPKHEIYVEPFAGAASLFFAKKPVKKEVISDIDPELINFYKKLRNVKTLKCDIKPSEKSFYEVKKKNPKSLCDFYYYNQCSYGCKRETYGWGKCERNKRIQGIKVLKRNLPKIQERLKQATILNEDFEKVVKKFDSPKTFFYFDPPYHKIKGVYRYGDFDTKRLAEVCKRIKGKFLISLNDHPEVWDMFKGFHIKRVKHYYTLQNKGEGFEAKKPVTELLIANYDLDSPFLGNPRPKNEAEKRRENLLDFCGVLLVGTGIAFMRKNSGFGSLSLGLGLILLSSR